MDLFSDIPKDIMLKRSLDIPALPEVEVEKYFRRILETNVDVLSHPCFLGGGVWIHYVPPIVDEVTRSPEFLTSYTPYQPEVSQGVLQALFEYQSMIADLYGMDVANASMYDWGSALAEALLMAIRIKKKRAVLIPSYLPPWRQRVVETYLNPHGIEIRRYGYGVNGQAELSDIKDLAKDVSAVYIENPNFFGVIEEKAEEIGEIAHSVDALYIVGADPLSLGVYMPPGEYGADIAVGEGQHLGSPPSFGGPSLGIFAIRGELKLIWQMPGRLIGLTRTKDGSSRGFVMALQAREQHIKRERATSNICTNEAYLAIRAAIYLAYLGASGIRMLGEKIVERTYRLMSLLDRLDDVEAPMFKGSYYFREFPARLWSVPVEEVNRLLWAKYEIIGGLNLGKFFPNLGNAMLLATTEIHSDQDQNMLVEALRDILG